LFVLTELTQNLNKEYSVGLAYANNDIYFFYYFHIY